MAAPPTATLRVKVVPGASRTRIAGRYGDGIKVQLAVAAERGRANQALVELLAEALGVKPAQIAILSGLAQPRKVLQITGLQPAELQAKLADFP